jgi:hypothetical protein
VKAKTFLLVLCIVGFGASASAASQSAFASDGLSTTYAGPEGVSEPKSQGLFSGLSGFFAVTSTQDGPRGNERTDQIVVGREADLQIDELCARADNNIFSTRTYCDTSVWLTFIAPGDSASDGSVLKLSNVGAVDEGECISVKKNDVLVPEERMYSGPGVYNVEADLVVFDENYEASIITQEADKGEIELIENRGDTSDKAKEIVGEITSINPSEDGGNVPRVSANEEITFTFKKSQGVLDHLDWRIIDLTNPSNPLTLEKGTIDKDSSTYQFDYTPSGGGTTSVLVSPEPAEERTVSEPDFSRKFFVEEERNTKPEADLDVDGDTFTAGEDVDIDLGGSRDPDGEIRWFVSSVEKDGEEVKKGGETSTFNFQEPGDYTIEATVTDQQGASDTETVEIEVEERSDGSTPGSNPEDIGESFCEANPDVQRCLSGDQRDEREERNFAPQIQNIQVPGTAVKGESFTATVVASDPNEGDSLSYEWSNGATGETANFEFGSTGLKSITVTATDSAGKTATDSSQVQVERQDRDGDGVPDTKENPACIDLPGTPPNGCPPAPQPPIPTDKLGNESRDRVSSVVESSSFFTFLAASSRPETVPAEEKVTQPVSVSVQGSTDTDFEDGNSTRYFGTWVVIDDGEVRDQGSFKRTDSVQGSITYSKEFDRSFSEPGTYAYQVQVVESKGSYDYSTETWSFDTELQGSERYTFNVETSNSGGAGGSSPGPVPDVPGLGGTGLLVVVAAILSLIVAAIVVNQRR